MSLQNTCRCLRLHRYKERRLWIEALEDRHLLAGFTPAPNVDDGDSMSLRAAIVASQSNQQDDTIELSAGIYTLRLGDLVINEPTTNLRIEGAGADQTVIKIEGDARAFDVDFGARLDMSGVTILSGNTEEGGQIRSAGTVELTDVLLHSGTATQGGAIFNGGDLTLSRVEFVANKAGVGGGIWNHAGATLTANDTRWIQNETNEQLGARILSAAQLGISIPGSEQSASIYALPPRGGTALFNAGVAHLKSVEIAGNVSDTGAAIHNIGDAAELRIEDSLIYDNDSARREGAPAVLFAMRGTVDIVQSAIFNNSSLDGYGGTMSLYSSTIDMSRVAVFNNPSPSIGFRALQSSVRMEHVTWVRSGPRGLALGGAPHTVFEFTASAFERIGIGTQSGQQISRGGNRFGFGDKYFDQPTDVRLSDEDMEDLFWRGESFDFLPAGIYQGRVALPPTATSQLIDALPTGEDAGAFEYVSGMELEAPLPTVSNSGGITLLEDSGPIVLDSLVPGATHAIAAYGQITRNDQGQLTYQRVPNFEGQDHLVVQGADGQMRSLPIVVTPQPDPPTIEDYTVTVLGRSEVLGLEKPTSTEVTDVNALGAYVRPESLQVPEGNPTPGPDIRSEITARGFVIDGELVLNNYGPDPTADVPYWLTGDVKRPNVNVEYVPVAGFSGIDTRTVRVVNSSGLTAEATATFNVLDPAAYPDLGRITATILDENLQPTDSVRVGELFFVEYRIDDIRDESHPLASVQRDYSSITATLNVGGTPLQRARVCKKPECGPGLFGSDGKTEVPAQGLGNFTDFTKPANRLDASNLRVDANMYAMSRESGPFYRISFQATAPGTITADIPFVTAIGLGMSGHIPYDWFEVVSDSVEVTATNQNVSQPEDVNEDGVVAPGDALILINALNDQAAESETSTQTASTASSYMWDVNGDGQLSPNDALVVVNYLNNASATGSGEGEASVTKQQPLSYPLLVPVVRNTGVAERTTVFDEVLSDEDNASDNFTTAAPSQSNPNSVHETHNLVWEAFGQASDEESDGSLEFLLAKDLCL